MNERLLTHTERKPFDRGGAAGLGGERRWEPDWNIDDLLAAQDAKTEPLVRADERKKTAEWLEAGCSVPHHNHQHAAPRSTCGTCLSNLVSALREGRTPWDKE